MVRLRSPILRILTAIAGYGECAMWYIGTDRIYTDRGGYEQNWSFVAPCVAINSPGRSRLIHALPVRSR